MKVDDFLDAPEGKNDFLEKGMDVDAFLEGEKAPSPTWEALKKTAEVIPAHISTLSKEFLKGATLGVVDVSKQREETYLKEKEALPTPPWAKTVAHLAGEFLPIGAIMKVISPVVKFSLAGAGMVRTAAMEAALTGATYEAVKGAAQGKDPVEILKEMGYTGPQWAVLGAGAGKLGAVLSKAKGAKPEDVAADLKKAQEEIESTIIYTPGKAEPKFEYAPEWTPPAEGKTIPFRRYPKQELTFQPSAETPMRIGPRPPEGGIEIPPMRQGPTPETKLLAPPPDWIPGKPITARRPFLETPPSVAEFKGPREIFVESEKGPVEVKWNAEKKVYEPILPTEKVPPAPSGEVETRKLAPDYVEGYLSQYKKGSPGISEGLTRKDESGEIVYRNESGKPVGVIAYSPKFITDVAVDPKFQRTGIATKLIEEVNKKGITEFRGPYSEEGAALIKTREIPTPEGGTKKIPLDRDKNELVDMDNVPMDINPDGTITLYHRTSPEKAAQVRKSGVFKSLENTEETFFSNKLEGQGQGYGDSAIAVKVRPSDVRINDAFHGGEIHVAVSNKRLSKGNIISEPLISEEGKRAQIRIEGKTVNGLAQDILSETPAKQNAAIEAVKKAVEEGKITQKDALEHFNNEMMNISHEKITGGANLNATLEAAQRAGMTFTEKITKEVRPDAQAIFRKLKGEPIPYLNEKINYGGDIRSRGSVIAEMQKQGTPQKQIDAYMMGAKTIGESGKVDLDLLRHITISGLGAATGAILDEENRWRGAIIGGATGFAISRGLLRKVLGERAVAKIPETKAKIELPPIKEGPITQPVLRLDINKNIANVTEDLFRAAGMKWDPELLITDQIATALKTVPVGTFNQILGNVGVPVEEFTKYYFRQSITKYAKGLGEWGAVVRRLMKDNPEAQKALDDISRAVSDMDAMASAGDWWKRVDNIRRGLLVTQLATAMRNAETQVGRIGLDVFEQGLEAGLQRLFKRRVTTNPLDGLESLMTLFRRGKKADVEKILNAKDPNGNALFEGEFNRLFLTYSSDIMRGRGEGIPEKIVDTLNVANRFQEYAIRRTVLLSKLDQRMRAINQDLGKIIERNEIGKISEDDVKYAVNQALEFTWAQSPKYGSIAQKFISFVNSMPGATYLLPFPRFLMNSIKFQFDYSPLGAFKLLSSQERLAIKGGDMRTISRSILGTAMLATAYQIRNSEYAGEKWYELNVGGRPVDTRAYNPFASYLFVADVVKKARDGSLYKLGANDIIQGLFSTNLRAGSGLYVVDRVLDAFADEAKTEKAVNTLKQFGGEVAAGFLTPVKQVRDFLYGFDDMVLKETRGQEPFLGPIKATIPGVEKEMEPRYKPTRAEPPKWPAPGVRQATGISVGEPKNTLEKELDRLGFERREILPSVGDAKVDNLIAQKMGAISEEIGLPLLEDKSYRDMGDAEKGYFLSRMMSKFRTAAKKEAQGDNPELFEKITRTSRRKEIFLKSLEGG